MTVEHVVGDLFEQDVAAIGHGVNCKGLMGSGIAVLFKEEFPEMHTKYVELCEAQKLKLGMVWPWKDEELELTVFNMATQFKPGRNADMDAVKTTVQKVLAYCEKKGLESVALPRIGSGIGGLKWDEVAAEIEKLAGPSKVHVVLVTHPKDL